MLDSSGDVFGQIQKKLSKNQAIMNKNLYEKKGKVLFQIDNRKLSERKEGYY